MEIGARGGRLPEAEADTIVVNLLQGVTQPSGATGALDEALGGAISRLIEARDFTGKLNQTAVLYPPAGGARQRPPGSSWWGWGSGRSSPSTAPARRPAPPRAARGTWGPKRWPPCCTGPAPGAWPPARPPRPWPRGACWASTASTS